jgi:phosphoesterase RecJ-like protein
MAVKVSWRAMPNFDVSLIALKFGGGGHPSAAGADVAGSLDDVRQRVLQETRQLVNMERIA